MRLLHNLGLFGWVEDVLERACRFAVLTWPVLRRLGCLHVALARPAGHALFWRFDVGVAKAAGATQLTGAVVVSFTAPASFGQNFMRPTTEAMRVFAPPPSYLSFVKSMSKPTLNTGFNL